MLLKYIMCDKLYMCVTMLYDGIMYVIYNNTHNRWYPYIGYILKKVCWVKFISNTSFYVYKVYTNI